ncbi:MAG: prenyltransferase [Methanobacteriota archaeon]
MDFQKFINIVKLGRVIVHAAILVYLLGALFAVVIGASFDVYRFILGYAVVFTGVLAAGYTNNYYDVAIDRFATHTPFSGGSGILVDHPEYRKTIRTIMVFLYSLSIVLGLVFTIVFSYPVTFFAFVVIADFFGWCYTAPPLRLVYRGFGEIITMFGTGFLITGFGYFAVMGTIDVSFVLFSIPFLLFGFALSFYLEIPDRNVDCEGHKKTLVALKGESLGFVIGAVSLGLATLCFLMFGLFHVFPGAANFFFIGMFSLVPAVLGVWGLRGYIADQTKMMTIVFRTTACIFVVFILIDAYFMYVILF